MKSAAATLCVVIVLGCGGGRSAPAAPPPPDARLLPQGLVFGDVTATTAILWARAEGASEIEFEVTVPGAEPRRLRTPVALERDATARITLDELSPGTQYPVRATARGGATNGAFAEGRFRTAPAATEPAEVRLLFGGDVAGQNVCRDATEGFPIFASIRRAAPDLFIGLGDMIYADDVCLREGRYGNLQVPGEFVQATDEAGFWAHWRYAREEAGLRSVLENAPYVAVWDDHETLNDAGPHQDSRDVPPYQAGVSLLPIARTAFLDWNPVTQPPDDSTVLSRTLRWGRHVEVFVLDTRGYRDANVLPDRRPGHKTMLGAAQRAWLEERLLASDATWKIVISSVPISIPTGSAVTGRDGWSGLGSQTGFHSELEALLRTLADRDVRNLVFLTTDVHFGAAFRYRPFEDRPGFVLHELVTGPLNAGLFPNPVFDPALGAERLFFHGPASIGAVTRWEDARRWFNYGAVVVAADGSLALEVHDVDGALLFSLPLQPR